MFGRSRSVSAGELVQPSFFGMVLRSAFNGSLNPTRRGDMFINCLFGIGAVTPQVIRSLL